MKMRDMIFKNALCLAVCIAMPACQQFDLVSGNASSLQLQSIGKNQMVLPVDCATVVCAEGFANEGDIWITDIPMDNLQSGNIRNGQIIRIQLLWFPKAGKTPLAETSTNFVIEHIIIAEGEVGIYGGGGYCWPKGTPENGMTLKIEDATIAIQQNSQHFADLLTPATLNGTVIGKADKETARLISAAAQRFK